MWADLKAIIWLCAVNYCKFLITITINQVSRKIKFLTDNNILRKISCNYVIFICTWTLNLVVLTVETCMWNKKWFIQREACKHTHASHTGHVVSPQHWFIFGDKTKISFVRWVGVRWWHTSFIHGRRKRSHTVCP